MLLTGIWKKEKKAEKVKCLGCREEKQIDDGFAFCSECIEKARQMAINKSVSKHIKNGFKHLFTGKFMFAKIDFSWALEKFLIK